jgi:hypothetical protein
MDIAEQIELHSVEGIRRCFSDGIGPNDIFKGQPLLFELTSEYTRSPRFKNCVKAFIDSGLTGVDDVLLSVLTDDTEWLTKLIERDPTCISQKFTLRCAYTPLHEATLLHICAEFNHVNCAELLLQRGLSVNARAGTDEFGFGGQTPLFHTVNQNGNQSKEMLDWLLAHGADPTITVKGLIWGKGYDWETFIPSVNPISYAMMGLLPQMHRNELTISQVITQLTKYGYGITYTSGNVPNAYLKK